MMVTIQQLAERHGVNASSLGVHLWKAGIKATRKAPRWPHANEYDEGAAAAVAALLQSSPITQGRGKARKSGRPTRRQQ